MFIELHFIQSFPPSVLNRDDSNNPKDAYFGGVRRLRVSSQCIKRAIRLDPVFLETTQVPLSTRTKYLALEWLKPELKKANMPQVEDAEVEKVALAFAEAYSGKMYDKDKNQTAASLFLTPHEVSWSVNELKDRWPEIVARLAKPKADKDSKGKDKDKKEKPALDEIVKKLITQTEKRTNAPDIALFGRMLADKPETNIDAACQIGHAISTHAVRKFEVDYFTAVDELKPDDSSGASMVGMIPFASGCFYRYMRLDWDLLKTNLRLSSDPDGLALKTVEGFLRAAEAATPTGKKTSFDNNSRPNFMLAVARSGGPGWSLVNAFEKPVSSGRDGGYVEGSVEKLGAYWERHCEVYGEETIKAKSVLLPDAALSKEMLTPGLQTAYQPSLKAWAETMLAALKG